MDNFHYKLDKTILCLIGRKKTQNKKQSRCLIVKVAALIPAAIFIHTLYCFVHLPVEPKKSFGLLLLLWHQNKPVSLMTTTRVIVVVTFQKLWTSFLGSVPRPFSSALAHSCSLLPSPSLCLSLCSLWPSGSALLLHSLSHFLLRQTETQTL